MAGTYNGSLHDFGTGNLSVSFKKQQAILDKGQMNALKAAKATGKPVVSADGRRLLAVPVGGPVTPRASVPSAGPGRVVVGSAPSSGPGVPVVVPPAVPVGGGPGLGVVTTGGAFTTGPAAGAVVMAGSGEWFQGPDLSVGLGKDQEQATAYKQFNIWIQPSPWFTDAKFFEDRAGDDGLGSFLNNTLTPLADYGNTAVLGIRHHVLGDLNKATAGMKPAQGSAFKPSPTPYLDSWPPK